MNPNENQEYDEFGNPLNHPETTPFENDSFEIYSEESIEDNKPQTSNLHQLIERPILHEEKQYYPLLEEKYPDAEAMIQEEDLQSLEEPMIKPPQENTFYSKLSVTTDPSLNDFIAQLYQRPQDVRNVAIIGSYHSGKTTLCDLLISSQDDVTVTDPNKRKTSDLRFERERKLTIQSKPFSIPLIDSKSKHYMFNFIDTPGHPDFFSEVRCSLEIVDAVLLVVDCLEGVTQYLLKLMKEIQTLGLDVILVFNKLDRFIIETKMPPEDCFLKLRQVLNEIQQFFPVCPTKNNVFFASAKLELIFNLQFFVNKSFAELKGEGIQVEKFLWNNVYYDVEKNQFTNSGKGLKRSFVQFVLMPIYKVFAHSVAKDKDELDHFLGQIGLSIKSSVARQLSLKDLLKNIFRYTIKDVPVLVDKMVSEFQDTFQGNKRILKRVFDRSNFDELFWQTGNHTLGIIAGNMLHRSTMTTVDGESGNLSLMRHPRISYPRISNVSWSTKSAFAGNLVFVSGVGDHFGKNGYIHSQSIHVPRINFLSLTNESLVKMAIEPLRPANQVELTQGLAYLSKFNPSLKIKIEGSGETTLYFPGEMGADAALFFLREHFAKTEIRLSEPSSLFTESPSNSSQMIAHTHSLNKKNEIQLICESVEKEFSNHYETLIQLFQKFSLKTNEPLKNNPFFTFCKQNLGWDALMVKSFWSLDDQFPAILINETFLDSSQNIALESSRESLIKGFKWALKEGPLCEEPLRDIRIKIVEIKLSSDPVFRTEEQLIPMMRNAIHKAFLLSSPRIKEPFYTLEATSTTDALPILYSLLAPRRANLISEIQKPGTIHTTVLARIPILDSFGLEVDLRVQSLGQSGLTMSFYGWEFMSGDPLDREAKIPILEPCQPNSLARDVMIKTRRRRGLKDDIALIRYFEEGHLINALKSNYLA